MVRKENEQRAQRAKDDVFHEVMTRSWRSTRLVTTIKSNEMKPMNLQDEVKKLEEQESAINVACPMGDEASWVITRRKSQSSMVRLCRRR